MFTKKVKISSLKANTPTLNGNIYPPHVIEAACKSLPEKLKIYESKTMHKHDVLGYVSGVDFDGEHMTAIMNFRNSNEDSVDLANRVTGPEYEIAPIMTSKFNSKNEAYDAKIWGFSVIKVK